MKAMVLHERGGTLRHEEAPKPQVGFGEALVRVRACGAGLTVVHILQGRLGSMSFPRIIAFRGRKAPSLDFQNFQTFQKRLRVIATLR